MVKKIAREVAERSAREVRRIGVADSIFGSRLKECRTDYLEGGIG